MTMTNPPKPFRRNIAAAKATRSEFRVPLPYQ